MLVAALFVNVSAAGFADNFSGGLSIADTVQTLKAQSAGLARPVAVAANAGARTYEFQALYKSLGYPDPGFFGASEQALQDLDSYTSKYDAFYEEINGYLRFYPAPYDWSGTGPEDAKLMVANIDGIINKAPALPADLVLFRGLDLKFRKSKPYAINEEFVDKGYVSTSTSYKVARYFAIEMNDNATTKSRKAVFTLYSARPGQKGLLIDQNEDEVILRHGMKYRVMAKKDNVKKYDLYLVQVCGDVCETTLKTDVGSFWANLNITD
mgnify:CR=1 FL=1